MRLRSLVFGALTVLLVCVFPGSALGSTGAPSIVSQSVAEVRNDGASLAGEVDPDGLSTIYWFEYGACGSPTSCVASGFEGRTAEGSLAVGTEVEGVGAQVSGLRAGTTYRYRLVAENTQGRVGGGEGVFSTWTTGAFGLPDGRAWEMVSPADKHGALIQPIGEDWAIQAAAQGGRMVFEALSPTESHSAGYPLYQPALATRGSDGGWSSWDLAIPHVLPTELSVGAGWEYRYFSEDLSRTIVQPMGPFTPCEPDPGVRQPCLSPEATEQTAFLGSDYAAGGGASGAPCTSSCFTPFATTANTPPGTKFGISTFDGECPPKPFCGPFFLSATSDLSHVLLESHAALTPSPAAGVEIPKDSLYEWSEGKPTSEQLRLVSVLPGNSSQEALPAKQVVLGAGEGSSRNVISPDGNRVVFGSEGNLYLRENASQPQSPIGPGGECVIAVDACTIKLNEGLSGSAEFQTANTAVTRIFFTDGSPVGLYEYDLARDKIVALAAGARVLTYVIGASDDGSWIYFAANGALAAHAINGNCAQLEATCNLYAMHFDGAHWESPKLVAVLSASDNRDWADGGRNGYPLLTARVSPNGRWLAFMSDRSLTGFDNRDAVSGEPDEEVYEYDAATGGLVCASCNPAGSRPAGKLAELLGTPHGGISGGFLTFTYGWIAANLPPWTPSLTGSGAIYQSRYLSNSGRLFFDASDQLVPKDGNGTGDVYEFEPEGVPAGSEHACSDASGSGSVVFEPARSVRMEGRTVNEYAGCVGLISSGESSEESAFLDADETGSEVFFLTSGKLAGEDVDTLRDVYVARECSSASPCATPSAAPPKPCDNEASCKTAPSPQPEIFGSSGSATFSGSGNPITPLSGPAAAVKKQSRPLTRAQKLARALRVCGKDRDRRKRAACEKRARKSYGVKANGRAGR